MRRLESGPGSLGRFPERLPSPLEWRFSGVGAESFRVRPMAASVMPCVGRAEVVDVDRGQLVMRRLEDVAVVVHLDELAPFGGGHGRDPILAWSTDSTRSAGAP